MWIDKPKFDQKKKVELTNISKMWISTDWFEGNITGNHAF
jgi:hypothetical protein